MAELYCLDGRLITEKPEIRVGDKIYTVDNRMSVFLKLSDALKDAGGRGGELRTALEHGLGESAAAEIMAMDLSVAAAQSVLRLTLAAMQGITEEEAERRFQG
jgi:hypothetical protein